MPLSPESMFFGFANTLTIEQKDFVNACLDKQLVICNSPAGTGKTQLAVACAKLLGKPLVYVFSAYAENAMGYRPGSQGEKEASYLDPLYGALIGINEQPSSAVSNEMNAKSGKAWVQAKSHTFMRGVTLSDCTVIIDEAQNMSRHDLKKILTRISDTCTCIILGHTGQIDIDPVKSGFDAYIKHFEGKPYCKVIALTKNFRGRLSQDADALI